MARDLRLRRERQSPFPETGAAARPWPCVRGHEREEPVAHEGLHLGALHLRRDRPRDDAASTAGHLHADGRARAREQTLLRDAALHDERLPAHAVELAALAR